MEDCQNTSQSSLKRKPEGVEDDLNDLKRPLDDAQVKDLPKDDQKAEESKSEVEKGEALGEAVIVQASDEKIIKLCENEELGKDTVEKNLETIEDKKIQLEDTNKDVGGIKGYGENGDEKVTDTVNKEVVEEINSEVKGNDGKVEEGNVGDVKNNEESKSL